MEEDAGSKPVGAIPRRRRRIGTITVILIRCVIGGVFLVAGVSKAGDLAAFSGDLQRYRLFPEATLIPLASYLPFLEILVGSALILGALYSGALFLSGGMLAAFSVVLVSAWSRGLDITCGCFGRGLGESSVEVALVRVLILALGWSFLVWMFLRQHGERQEISHG